MADGITPSSLSSGLRPPMSMVKNQSWAGYRSLSPPQVSRTKWVQSCQHRQLAAADCTTARGLERSSMQAKDKAKGVLNRTTTRTLITTCTGRTCPLCCWALLQANCWAHLFSAGQFMAGHGRQGSPQLLRVLPVLMHACSWQSAALVVTEEAG